MSRVLIVCPGRGSYGRTTLGSLQQRSAGATEILAALDDLRAADDKPTLRHLDAEPNFRASLHLAGQHASILTFGASLADLADLHDSHEIVGITGNSMGWYTALVAAGALSLDEGYRLVETMASYQTEKLIGAQLMTPLCPPDWSDAPEMRQAVHDAVAAARAAGHQAHWSIDLGTFAVLGTDKGGADFLMKQLPEEKRGPRTFPAKLPKHAAFHTPLMDTTSARALQDLADLRLQAPRVPLIDGHGNVWHPRWACPVAMKRYTLGAQVTETYNFNLAIRTALAHTCPDLVVLLGPGNGLGGATAAAVVDAHWRGVTTKADLIAHEPPLVRSFGREADQGWLSAPPSPE